MKCLFHPFSSFTLNSLFTHSHMINTHHKALSISCHAPLHIWTYLNVLSTFDQSPNSTHSTPPSFPSNYLNSTLIILKTSSPHEFVLLSSIITLSQTSTSCSKSLLFTPFLVEFIFTLLVNELFA